VKSIHLKSELNVKWFSYSYKKWLDYKTSPYNVWFKKWSWYCAKLGV